MSKVKIEERGDVAIIRLDHQVTNAIGPELVKDLGEALNQVKGGYRGVVLAGGAKFFSIGFNLPELLQMDRPAMSGFFSDFDRLCFGLFTLDMPVACAISGHAIAGGCVLALTADYRFAGSEKKLIGVNEVKIGIPAPYLADLLLRQIVGDRAASEILYTGEFLSMSAAQKVGLIDDVCGEETVEEKAVAKVAVLAAMPRSGFAAIKANRADAVAALYGKNRNAKNELLMDCWFSDTAQALLREAAAKF